jgi:Asp-tRNA(Asn)/Glu-tRNA(Gln) amidotransferase A subunit family amidase
MTLILNLDTPSEMQERVRAAVRDRRLALGLTQSDLATRSGVPLATLKRFEQKGQISLAGLLAMSVPAAINADGLPLGLQLVGKPFDEQGVLDAGLAIQQRAGFSAKPDKWW